MPLNLTVESTLVGIAGAKLIGSPYCEVDPTGCAEDSGHGGEVAAVDVTFAVIRIPRTALLTNGLTYPGILVPECSLNPECFCGSSGSGGSGSGAMGLGGQLATSQMLGLTVQYQQLQLPPGSKVLGTYTLRNPVGCCQEQPPSGSGSGSAASGSGSAASGSFVITTCECIYPGKNVCPPCDNVPSQVLVDISGLLEGTCGSCASQDLFTTLSWVQNSGGCLWTGTFDSSTCFGAFDAQLQAVGGFWELLITDSTGKSVLWRLPQAEWNCCGVNQPAFVSQDAGLTCDFSKSTATILSCLDCCTNVCLYAGGCGPACQFGYSPAYRIRMVGIPNDVGCGSCSAYTEDQPQFMVISNAGCEWILNPAPGELDCLGEQMVSATSAPCLGDVLNVILDLGGDPLLIMQFENGTLTYQMPAADWPCCGEEAVFTGDMLVDQPDNLCDFTSNGFLVLVDACLNCCEHGGSSSSSSSGSGSSSGSAEELIFTSCCPDGIFANLHATLTSNCSCVDGLVVPISWTGTHWDGTAMDECGNEIEVIVTCTGGAFQMRINVNGLDTYDDVATSASCSPAPMIVFPDDTAAISGCPGGTTLGATVTE